MHNYISKRHIKSPWTPKLTHVLSTFYKCISFS